MMKHILNTTLVVFVCLAISGLFMLPGQASAASMQDYCAYPNFISQPVPPLVMFEAGRDHKLYYEAFNDATDIDEDGKIDLTYKHTIDYYGYFDHHKCYTYAGSGTGEFDPVSVTTTKFCSAGQWSGNFLNWMTMSRMDVLKKVLYGGHRISDSNVTVLERVYIPQDAHSWGKEFTGRLCKLGTEFTYECKSDIDCDAGYTCEDTAAAGFYLIPFSAATPPTNCSTTTAIGTTSSQITVARYYHPLSTTCGTDHADLMFSFDADTAANFIDTFRVTSFLDTRLSPTTEHYNDYNIMVQAEFSISSSQKGNWQFFVDSNDGAEVQIDGTVVASYYGCHPMCSNSPTAPLCDANQLGTINLNTSGYHKIIVRTSNHLGSDGVTVWYRIGTSGTWYPFPCTDATCTNKLTYRTVNIPSSAVCTIQNNSFINNGVPLLGTSTGRQHLFCNTALSDGGVPKLRMLSDNTHRIWEWASKERPVCADTFSDLVSTGTITDYTVRVKVCDSTIGLESNCKTYGGTSHKPVGLLQNYGENSTGAKVCSKNMTKSCSTNSDCTFATEGQCMYKADMYFGLMTTSYTYNLSGGVLRKNIGSILDETNFNNGYLQSSADVPDAIIRTIDRLKTVGFRYTDHSYQDTSGGNCGWITTRALNQGECRMWGNPIGEMMYESLRYFAGKNIATTDYNYSSTQDSGLGLSLATWGYKDGSNYFPPYSLYPRCSRPFMLVLSDVNPSYDHDQLPGSAFSTFAEDSNAPMLNMNVSTLADIIGTTEGINTHNWFIGESGTTNNFLCTPKNISTLSTAKGLCPEEPTKKGTYYSAAVAYYGKTKLKDNTGIPNTDTFVIALASPLADMKFKAGSNIVTVLPVGKSVSGGLSVYESCAQKCTLSRDATTGELNITSCGSDAYCPSNQIVDMYIDSIKYDINNNVIHAEYRINFEDVEQGADHDMDAIVKYEICTQAAQGAGYGTCGGDGLGSNDIEIKVDSSQYGAGSIDQVMGFVISGTTDDGVYLVVKDDDVPNSSDTNTPTIVAGMPKTYSRTFATTGNASGFLKNPLWYAAKWGGFDDFDGDSRPYTSTTCGTSTPDPKCAEWDKDGNGDPDNYFLVVNPQKLEDQMNAALTAMLAKASSGTAASVLASGEGSGANLIQAVFYPLRKFHNTAANMEDTIAWTGRLTNMWYFVDPKLASSNIREDDGDSILNLKSTTTGTSHDYITSLYFDNVSAKAKAHRWEDPNGDGVIGTQLPDADFEELGNLWEAGTMLWKRDVTTDAGKRKIYTTIDGTSLLTGNFSSNGLNGDADNSGTLASYMSVTAGEAKKLIDWVQGVDVSGYRSRTIKIESIDATARVWKLGDIVNSTPKIASWLPLNRYNIFYQDDKYGPVGKLAALGDPVSDDHFTTTAAYKGRGMVFAGGNDGMLHAFKLGQLQLKWSGQDATEVSRMVNLDEAGAECSADDDEPCGKEMWAFIPKNALPYLKYLADPGYCHLYSVDLTPFIVDASINGLPDDPRTASSFRTILIGGMRFGGACKNSTDSCTTTDCVKTPITTAGYTDVGRSSYFALDITDQNNPTLLWEFTNPDLGFATTGPAVLRINGKNAGVADSSRNGNWFMIFGSGPTGPISTTDHQFMGTSNQNLKLFILNLKTGQLLRTLDTGISNAFAGSLYAATLDTDTKDYQDELMYVPYVKKCTADTAAPSSSDFLCKINTWTNGGVLRLVTNRSSNPDPDWKVSTLIDNIGPVTSAPTKILDLDNKNLWVYAGAGRYYYARIGEMDDAEGKRFLFGFKDPCYKTGGYDPACTDAATFSSLTNVTTWTNGPPPTVSVTTANSSSFKGWYLALDSKGTYTYAPDAATVYNAERVITDPLAAAGRGILFFTTYKPSADLCAFGGKSFIWAVQYNTGGPPGELKGTALIQVSTGAIEQKDLSTAFTDAGGRKSAGMSGKPPEAQGLSIISNPPATKKVIHIKER